jgi:hypothetical protein
MGENQGSRTSAKRLCIAAGVLLAAGIITTANISPFRAFGGAVWLKGGVHYISNAQISNRIEQINIPKEKALANNIASSAPNCDDVDEGFCERSPGDYYEKVLVSPAVQYQPGTPDRREIIGHCTLCNDGTYSPSCAVGRGACSWHDGVAVYNAPQYRTIPGTPAVQAREAAYDYRAETYKDSPDYVAPATPSLNAVVGL